MGLRQGNAERRSVPNTRDASLVERIVPGGGSAQMVEPVAELQASMARDGVRYGDPALPRYATGRCDGEVPPLNTRQDFTLRTRRAGAGGDHAAQAGLVQPKRRS